MRKIFLPTFLLAFFLATSFWAGSISAKGKPIPEENGVYADPDHPGIKVRVFVHNERPAKPTPPPPVLQCGLLDPNSEAKVSPAGWQLGSTWTYNLNPESVPSSVGGANLEKIASDGFNEWNAPTRVNFTKGTDTTMDRQAYDSQNIIAWGRTSGTALGVTYIRYTSSGQVVDVDTIMNKKFRWSWSDSNSCAWPDAYDAENILTHELGHWVGLDDEYDAALYEHATMYGYGTKGEVKKDTLTTGDASGAAAIYPL